MPAKVRRLVAPRPDGTITSAYVVLCKLGCADLGTVSPGGFRRGIVASHETHNGAHMAKARHNRSVHA